MAIKIQYNKTALQQIEKQLKVRVRALPTLKNKESALRIEVKKAKEKAQATEAILEQLIEKNEGLIGMWQEFNSKLLRIDDVELSFRKLAGVRIPLLEKLHFSLEAYSYFSSPKWLPEGVAIMKEAVELAIKAEIFYHTMELLFKERKKTTQKVNLYEKVQIPGFSDAIRKIKRFLEDQENLSKAAQKIIKSKKEREEKEEKEVV